jgi:DNA-binding CsgD family transcriptional regulator/tetratricopeptide (TPR) repeat protein
MTEALEARQEALEIWQQLGDECRQGDTLRWMSRLSWFLGRKTDAETYGSDAVKILEKLLPTPELAMAYSNRAQLHMLADECDPAILWGGRAIELAEQLYAVDTLVHALNNVGTAELMADKPEGRDKLEESLRLALAKNLHEHAARAYTNLSSCAVRDRDYKMGMTYLDRGIAFSSEHDLDSWTLYMTSWRARAHFEQGNWDAAADDADFVLGKYAVSSITRIPALSVLGHVRVRRGDPDALQLLDEALELALRTREAQRIAPVATARAEYAWLHDDLDQTMREAQPVLDLNGVDKSPWELGEILYWMWRAGGVAEQLESVAAPYVQQLKGDWRKAASGWKELGCPYEEAMALADGDETAQREALEIFEKLGAGPMAGKLRQVLRATGVRSLPRGPRPSTRENPAGLTNRQVEVLSCMADGLSNAEIADRLFISPKTVDHHVSAILCKLGARTRGEAVALALQSGYLNQNRERSAQK